MAREARAERSTLADEASLGGDSADPAFRRVSALIIRLCAGAWFLFLSTASFRAISGPLADLVAGRAVPDTLTTLFSEGCGFVFYMIICCIMILRPEPVSRARGVAPALLALAGTYGPWLIPLLPRGQHQPALAAASAAILIFAEILTVYTLLTLGRSFSLTPQARKLVTGGPYAIVRHPLYVVEEAAIAAILLQYAWFAAVPFLVLHVTTQIRRMQLEEKVLLKSFSEYAEYARRTPGLVPGVW
jgi:protein-S-isoprenylcysteine O-methyltransferase Ste14